MSNSYSSLCDDFYQDMYVNTELELPRQRDTVLSFFERIQKQFPSMSSFRRRDNNEYCLEEDRNTGQYRWIALETDRIGSGLVNPSCLEDAYNQHKLVLDLIPYMLSVSHLDIHSLDVAFSMDFDCAGSHDEVIAEALFGSSAFNCLLELPSARPLYLSPEIVVALTEDRRTQARVNVDSRTSIYEAARKNQQDEPIALTLTIRQYTGTEWKFDTLKSFQYQCQLAEELMADKIIPNFVRPLTETIAHKGLI